MYRNSFGIREMNLMLPLRDEDLQLLEPGDVVFLTGTVFTGREGVYHQMFEKGIQPPVDIKNLSNVTFHCSPAITELSSGEYRVTSVTGTASFRFARYMQDFIEQYGIKAVIGKTGMPQETYKKVFKPNKAVYLNTIGYGLGATYGSGIIRVRDVVWKEELGLAQAMWFFDVERFGPFLVECDIEGNSLFENENKSVNRQLATLYINSKEPVLKRLGEITSPLEETSG